MGSDRVNGMKVENLSSLYSSGRRVSAALGLAWANCVNSRLFMSRNNEIVGKDSGLENGGDAGTSAVRTRKLQNVLRERENQDKKNLLWWRRLMINQARHFGCL
ncbi:hypothetical protein NE237_022995 [Protea cynaroides]|uniref:Uncharacterized protein n=1 Tax=Protea cynaroides TaxID=273540 RepID=A0A9Q0HD14_9MAGN|nr:hypothetical protein NE237_022995 [Protea cynaroides]